MNKIEVQFSSNENKKHCQKCPHFTILAAAFFVFLQQTYFLVRETQDLCVVAAKSSCLKLVFFSTHRFASFLMKCTIVNFNFTDAFEWRYFHLFSRAMAKSKKILWCAPMREQARKIEFATFQALNTVSIKGKNLFSEGASSHKLLGLLFVIV